jgi:uncharacterized protein (UPF0333 family)
VRAHPRRGQATTEWAVLLAVVVIAVVAAGWLIAGTFDVDMAALARRAGTVYASGDLGR